MSRSIKKGPFIDHHLMKKVDDAVKNNNKKPIKQCRKLENRDKDNYNKLKTESSIDNRKIKEYWMVSKF